MIVDSHTHVFSENFDSYPRRSEPAGVQDVVASAEQLKAEMDAAGVDRAVTISPWIYLWDNGYVMDCLADFSEWLATVVLVDPKAPDGPEKLRRLVSRGASGLRIHGRPFNNIACDDPVSTPLWRAAASPERFSHVILLAPFGLWDDDAQTFDFFAASPEELARAFYSDVDSEGALALAKAPQEAATEIDPDTVEGRAVIEYLVERAKTMMSAARFLWPIPNRGLSRRLFRLTMPTLVVWGADDGVVPPSYARRFAEAIGDCKTAIIPGASHMLNEEKPHDLAAEILTFVKAHQARVAPTQ